MRFSFACVISDCVCVFGYVLLYEVCVCLHVYSISKAVNSYFFVRVSFRLVLCRGFLCDTAVYRTVHV